VSRLCIVLAVLLFLLLLACDDDSDCLDVWAECPTSDFLVCENCMLIGEGTTDTYRFGRVRDCGSARITRVVIALECTFEIRQ